MTAPHPVLEKELQAAVMNLARRMGWRVWHFHDSRRMVRPGVWVGDKDASGFPDLVLAHPVHGVLFRELKADGENPTPKQRDAIRDLGAAGADIAVWRPADWPVRITRQLQGDA